MINRTNDDIQRANDITQELDEIKAHNTDTNPNISQFDTV